MPISITPRPPHAAGHTRVRAAVIPPRARRCAGLLCALLVVALAGCTGSDAPPQDDTPARPTVSFEDLALPAELSAPRDVTSGWSLAPATAELPTLAAAIRTVPGRAPAVGLWTGAASGVYERLEVDLGVSGSVESLELAADAGAAVLIGSQWDGTRLTSFARSSTDRITWAELDLPDLLDGWSWQGAVTVDGRTVAVAEDWQDRSVGVIIDDGDVRTFELPDVATGTSRDIDGVAAHGQEIAVLATVTPPGAAASSSVSRSADGGATWTEATL